MMCGLFKKKGNENTAIKLNITSNDEEKKNIEEMSKTHEQFKKLDILKKEYKTLLNNYYCITEELWNKNNYHLVISQSDIFNKYADRYIELCNMYLQILPEYIEFEKKSDIIFERKKDYIYAPQDIINMLRLLEKQEKYNEIINVSRYLLTLGITDDKTKKGIKGRIENAVLKFNKKYNTNYTYKSDDNLIIDLKTGEIME